MIIHIRKVANGYVITKEPDAALISPQPPTFVAEYETDAHRIVGELLGVTETLDPPQETLNEYAPNEYALIDTTNLDVEHARIFIDLSASHADRANALCRAFTWRDSPQGADFWQSIYDDTSASARNSNTVKACDIVARSIQAFVRENS